ncbi:CsbD family protein [Pseudomonas mangiferae]|uniref:CsbD family protein n=1 Tax=Pseudomonas mangiferae TaxID=2593654 RepID=A0A553GX75_9PSED|nr:CsbD family protein [Pseudomonas mangiferae]TRX74104.1 CsbD family protein [Pseudomonas mangiferae]
MNSDVIKGKWKQLTGKMKERWGDLTNDDLDVAEGHTDYLEGKLQERYGWTKDKAKEEVRNFSSTL